MMATIGKKQKNLIDYSPAIVYFLRTLVGCCRKAVGRLGKSRVDYNGVLLLHPPLSDAILP